MLKYNDKKDGRTDGQTNLLSFAKAKLKIEKGFPENE